MSGLPVSLGLITHNVAQTMVEDRSPKTGVENRGRGKKGWENRVQSAL